jgi:hypothetical protein
MARKSGAASAQRTKSGETSAGAAQGRAAKNRSVKRAGHAFRSVRVVVEDDPASEAEDDSAKCGHPAADSKCPDQPPAGFEISPRLGISCFSSGRFFLFASDYHFAWLRKMRSCHSQQHEREGAKRKIIAQTQAVLLARRRKFPILRRAGEGNRTLVCSLGSCRSTIELHPHVSCSGSLPG